MGEIHIFHGELHIFHGFFILCWTATLASQVSACCLWAAAADAANPRWRAWGWWQRCSGKGRWWWPGRDATDAGTQGETMGDYGYESDMIGIWINGISTYIESIDSRNIMVMGYFLLDMNGPHYLHKPLFHHQNWWLHGIWMVEK